LFLKRVKITKRWSLGPQTPAFYTFMFLRAREGLLSRKAAG